MASASNRRAWLLRRVLWTGFCLLIFGVAVLAFLLIGGVSVSSALRGALVGSLVIIWLVAVVELAVPSAFLRWREWMMEVGPKPLDDLGGYLDRRLMAGSQGRPSEATMRRRSRAVGAVVLVTGSLTVALVWWILILAHLI